MMSAWLAMRGANRRMSFLREETGDGSLSPLLENLANYQNKGTENRPLDKKRHGTVPCILYTRYFFTIGIRFNTAEITNEIKHTAARIRITEPIGFIISVSNPARRSIRMINTCTR